MVFMNSHNLSGQSAIEYLMTYGWMLLVVAVAGGAVFSTVGEQSIESVSGFTGEDVIVENFGVTSTNELEIELRNGASDSVEIQEITVGDGDEQVTSEDITSLSIAETGTDTVENVTTTSSTNSLDVDITYSIGSLENLEASGTITGQLEITDGATIEVDEDEDEEDTETVSTTGGNLTVLQTQTNEENVIYLTGESTEDVPPCVGTECENVDDGDGGETVSTGGAQMTGTFESTDTTEGEIMLTTFEEDVGDFSDSGEDLTSENTLEGDLETPTYISPEINTLE